MNLKDWINYINSENNKAKNEENKKKLDHYTKRAVNEDLDEDVFDIVKIAGKPSSEIAEDIAGYLGDTALWERAYDTLAKGANPVSRMINDPKEIKNAEKAKMDIAYAAGDPGNTIPMVELRLNDPLYTPRQRQELFYKQLVEGVNARGEPTSIMAPSRAFTPEYKKKISEDSVKLSERIQNLKADKRKALFDAFAKIGVPAFTFMTSLMPELKGVGTAYETREKIYKALPENVRKIIDTVVSPVSTAGKAVEGKILDKKEKQLLNDFFEHQKPDQVNLEDWAKVQTASDDEITELLKKYKDQLTEKYY